MPMILAEIPQLQNLTRDEMLQLVDELLATTSAEDVWTVSEEDKRILDERLAEHEANPDTSLNFDEFWRQWAELHPEWSPRHEL